MATKTLCPVSQEARAGTTWIPANTQWRPPLVGRAQGRRSAFKGQCRSGDKPGEHPSLGWLVATAEQEVARGKGWGTREREAIPLIYATDGIQGEGGCKAWLRGVWGRGCIQALTAPPTSAPWQSPLSTTAGSAMWLTVASGAAANKSSCGHVSGAFHRV